MQEAGLLNVRATQQSVTDFLPMIVMNLATLKVTAKHELLFNKHTSAAGTEAPFMFITCLASLGTETIEINNLICCSITQGAKAKSQCLYISCFC
jgi:hypothetical protein